MPCNLQKHLFALSFGFTLLILATHNAHAQPAQCALRPDVLAALATKYGEARRGIGIAGQNAVMELFVNPATGTWTILVTTPDGKTCLIASGSDFEATRDPAPAKGSPANDETYGGNQPPENRRIFDDRAAADDGGIMGTNGDEDLGGIAEAQVFDGDETTTALNGENSIIAGLGDAVGLARSHVDLDAGSGDVAAVLRTLNHPCPARAIPHQLDRNGQQRPSHGLEKQLFRQ